ncbi:hypothetical protein GCM10017688_57440 [Streptomyces ramulosus]
MPSGPRPNAAPEQARNRAAGPPGQAPRDRVGLASRPRSGWRKTALDGSGADFQHVSYRATRRAMGNVGAWPVRRPPLSPTPAQRTTSPHRHPCRLSRAPAPARTAGAVEE